MLWARIASGRSRELGGGFEPASFELWGTLGATGFLTNQMLAALAFRDSSLVKAQLRHSQS